MLIVFWLAYTVVQIGEIRFSSLSWMPFCVLYVISLQFSCPRILFHYLFSFYSLKKWITSNIHFGGRNDVQSEELQTLVFLERSKEEKMNL